MNATEAFQTILRSIECSNLNYSLSKTPFSASISLKCSFIKRYQETSPDNNICNIENMFRKSEQHDFIVQKLEADNLELRAELDTLKNKDDSDQKKLLEELVKLQNIYDHEKEESKAFEKNIAQFRGEVLELKKEKHKLSDILKLKEEECETLNTKCYALNVTNDALEKCIKDKSESVEMRNAELLSTKRDYESAYEKLIATQYELENLKVDKVTESKLYKCEKCDFTAETFDQLKLHNRYNHCQSKVTQCEQSSIFLKYNCYYCDNTFNSMDDRAAHHSDCQDQFDIIFQSQASFQTNENFACEMCDRIFNNVEEIERHMKAEHIESEVFWCDTCPLYFQSDCDLQFHIRGCHWDHM